MTPESWIEHRRDEDGELLGYLVPADDGRFTPVTVFGYPVGEPGDHYDATASLDALGLSYLAERWSLAIAERAEPVAVQIVEASPARVVVQSVDAGYEADYGTRFTLEAPVGADQLRPERLLRA